MPEIKHFQPIQISHFFTIMLNAQNSLRPNYTKSRRSASSLHTKIRESYKSDANLHNQIKRKQKIKYEISDNRKIIICSSNCSYSYTFEKVIQEKYFMLSTVQAILNKILKTNKIIICHNYTSSQRIALVTVLCKKLIKQLINYSILLNFQFFKQQPMKRNKNMINIEQKNLLRNQSCQHTLQRKINNEVDLNNFQSELVNINLNIQQINIQSSQLKYILIFANDEHTNQNRKSYNGLKIANNILYQKISKINFYNSNFEVCISSMCNNLPNTFHFCKQLQKAIDFQTSVQKIFNQISSSNFQKQDIFFTTHQNLNTQLLKEKNNQTNENPTLKLSHKNSSIVAATRKNSIQNLKLPNEEFQYTHKNQYINDSNQLSLSLQANSQNNNKFSMKQNIEKNKVNLAAENINLKYQLNAMHEQYKNQSQKYIYKMNKKVQSLSFQKIGYLDEIKKLQRQNANLCKQVQNLRILYETAAIQKQQILISRQKQKIASMKDQNIIIDLKMQISNLLQTNKHLQKRVGELQGYLEDSRHRYKNRIYELNQQIEEYKKFSEQIKIAYDEIESVMRMDNNRCQNLQKRCKKYQQSLTNLTKMQNYRSQTQNQDRIQHSNAQFNCQVSERSSQNCSYFIKQYEQSLMKVNDKQKISKKQIERPTAHKNKKEVANKLVMKRSDAKEQKKF